MSQISLAFIKFVVAIVDKLKNKLKTRLYEHKLHMKNLEIYKSSIAKHYFEYGHHFRNIHILKYRKHHNIRYFRSHILEEK